MSAVAPWPQAVRRRRAAPVGGVDAPVRAIRDEMLAAMQDTPGGVGLAAPQLGPALRLAVPDVSRSRREPPRLADPEIVRASAETERRTEGSPDLPDLTSEIERPAAVRLRCLDDTGAAMDCAVEGLWAAAARHRIDHLEGRVVFDRPSRVRRDRLLARHGTRARRGLA